jgi:Transposase DDE domain
MAKGESTKRSRLDADHLTEVLCEGGVAELMHEKELLLIMDGMDLRREYAQEQKYLMQVKSLEGGLVNGYRSINVLGLGVKEKRGLLYHRLFSSQAPGFVSENTEIEQAIDRVTQKLAGYQGERTWVIDRGFDNDQVWWKIWRQNDHLVCRVYHAERLVQVEIAPGIFQERYLDATYSHLKKYAKIETELVVRLQSQKHAKRQKVQVEISATPIWVYGDAKEPPRPVKKVWLVRVKVEHAVEEPWYLITDWPVEDEASAVRIFIAYRRRWSVEDTFKFIKTTLGMEEVQLLDFEAVRNLVALAWVAAGFLFSLGLTLDEPEVRLLALLGGWEERQDRPPGKIILSRGLRRLLDKYATDALLRQYKSEHGDLPAFVKKMAAKYGLPEI